MHDSQAAIPLARLTASRVESLYDLMDSAYDAPQIRAFSHQLGHVAIIDLNPRRRPQLKAQRKREALAQRCIGQVSPEARRYRERSTVERVNGRLKDEFGGRHLRVRGHGEVFCHLMFGILVLTVEQLMRLTLEASPPTPDRAGLAPAAGQGQGKLCLSPATACVPAFRSRHFHRPFNYEVRQAR